MDSPIRIGLVLSHFHPIASGAERQALAQAVELLRRGHSVRVITRSIPEHPVRDEVHQGIQIHRWIETWDRGPLFGVSFVAQLARSLRRLRGELDVIHTHQALWEAIGTGFARPWLGRTPTLIQAACSGYFGEAEELMRTRGAPILRRLILRNTHYAAISEEIEREWLALGAPAARLTRMRSGVDSVRFQPGPSLMEDRLLPRPRVIFTGRLHPQKNLPMLLHAWSEVIRRSNANLILVGPGDDREVLVNLAGSLGLADRVQFVGAVPDPADYLRAADVFVLPSVAEGMSNSLLEAMATALPCVASGIGGNTDLIQDGMDGRLVPTNSADAWAEILSQLLHDPATARRLGEAARRRIESEFALEVVVDHYVSLYRRLIDHSRSVR